MFHDTRALVADHRPTIRQQLRLGLESLGIHVEYASNGSRAIDRSLNVHFDVIFLASQLPILRATAVRKILRQSGVAAPIVFSCVTENDDLPELLAETNIARLVHPVDRRKLLALLSDLVPDKVVDSRTVQVRQSVDAMLAAFESEDLDELTALAQQLRELGETIGSSAFVALIGRLESCLDGDDRAEEDLRRKIEVNIAKIAAAAKTRHKTSSTGNS